LPVVTKVGLVASSSLSDGYLFIYSGGCSNFYAPPSYKSLESLFEVAAVLVAAVGGTIGVPSILARDVGFKNIPWFCFVLKYYFPP